MGFDFPATSGCDRVDVRSAVLFAFVEESLLDECVEVGIQPAVVDLGFVVVLELVFDCESVWFIQVGGEVQQVALEPGQIVHFAAHS
ncbi:hypothetical protein C457_18358 [Haloferax prahovense DSM 18310]|uniref:Uncharacterized protein n=1 Tax=Haloferax prahovense (strain DSM 18310 / JCM 13924 / TL6) TaxID=1227461 RepID=M0FZF4_HALPT|nr:hypothetical protein C457_18358 [Haloferax prahovense DSM 18310]